MGKHEEIKSKVLLKKKVLKYYNRFFSGEITITEIEEKCMRSRGAFDIIMEEFKRREEEKFNKPSSSFYSTIESEEENLDYTYPTIETIEPKKVIDLENNKVQLIYSSRVND